VKLDNITILDFETSGLVPERDRVIEVAAIRCYGGEVVSQFSTLIRFDGILPAKITEITGITSADLVNGMDEETAFRILNRIIGDSVIVAHNAIFDLGFLHHALLRFANRSFSNDFLDTLTICRNRHPYPHNLKGMCDRYVIELDGAHRALNDVYACWKLLEKLNAEQSVESDLNQLSYVKKFGIPKWYPPHASIVPIEIKYA
jgi:DNA polymerase-3 subunit epsilon